MKPHLLNLSSRMAVPIMMLVALILYYLGSGKIIGAGATYYLVHPISFIVFFLAVYLIFIEIKSWKTVLKESGIEGESFLTKEALVVTFKAVGLFLMCILGYIYFLKYISFVPATMIYLLVTFYTFKVRKKVYLIGLPIVLTLVFYSVFSILLKVPLP